MISSASRPYIDASVPVLREHGLAITRAMYSNMFKDHPELTNLFNMGNQANGSQQQSLAAAVFAYAANIDNPAALGPVIERIVHKHVSVGITAEHYPIVGRYLIGAIQQTLGADATPALLTAWDEAYGSLAKLFIARENALCAQTGVTSGQLRDMCVTVIRTESEEVISFTLATADGNPMPTFRPGQYVSLSVELGNGHRQLRQYSLSDTPRPEACRISVKRETADVSNPAGQISNWLHDHVKVGCILHMTHPFGEFAPDTDSLHPIVLLSAGIGITPMISVLNRIAELNPLRSVIFGHAAYDRQHHSHQTDLQAAKDLMPNLRLVTFYESVPDADLIHGVLFRGHMQLASMPAWQHSETNVYLCGPTPFMQAQWLELVEGGVPVQRLHREVFGPEMLDYLN